MLYKGGIVVGILFSVINVLSQQVQFKKSHINYNENLTLIVSSFDRKISKISPIPQFKDFKLIDSLISATECLYHFKPSKEGDFVLPSFNVVVDGKVFNISSKKITVSSSSYFQDFFKKQGDKKENTVVYKTEDIQLKHAEVVLNLNVLSKSYFVGEGISVELCIYLSQADADKYGFVDFESEYHRLTKFLKPKNCLEVTVPIDEIVSENVLIGSRKYLKFKLYEATYYPLSKGKLIFPELSLRMSHKRLLRKQKEILVRSVQRVLDVIPIPGVNGSHTNVGVFSVKEFASLAKVKVGQTFTYTFNIVGQGNIASLGAPTMISQDYAELMEEGAILNVENDQGNVKYSFQIAPKKKGKLIMSSLLYWPYFDPQKKIHDTLWPKISIQVVGEGDEDRAIETNQTDDFYKIIPAQKTKLKSINSKDGFKKWANVGFIVMLSFTLLFVLRRKGIKDRK